MVSSQELMDYDPSVDTSGKYKGPTTYCGEEIAPMNHPLVVAKYLLNMVQHTQIAACQIIGFMGSGKTSLATAICHLIHNERPEFQVIWGEADDFTNLKRFLHNLPKNTPLICVLDDLTSALSKMPQKEVEANLEMLTKIRHIVNSGKNIPIILITIGHYSLNMTKSYRSVLEGCRAFTSYGLEEQSNIDHFAPKGSVARMVLEKFAKISERMFIDHTFYLKLGNGVRLEKKVDEPLRVSAVLYGNGTASLTVFAKQTCCNLCAKKKTMLELDPKVIIEKIYKAHGPSGYQALRLVMHKRGHSMTLPPRVALACDYIEENIFTKFVTNEKQLVQDLWHAMHQRAPKRLYHKRAQEKQLTEEFYSVAVMKEEKPPEPLNDIPTFQNEVNIEPDEPQEN
jgi:hypothetical protein